LFIHCFSPQKIRFAEYNKLYNINLFTPVAF